MIANSIVEEATANEGFDDVEGLDDTLELGAFPIDSLMIRTETRSVFEVCRRIDATQYVMDPDFQRDFVWDPVRQSKLIESALLRIPLPVFYLAETKDGKVVVVDGLQRLTSFHRFLNGAFKLKGLEFAKNLNGTRFSDLAPQLQNRLEDTPLTLYLIDSAVPDAAKYEIFERVNGGIPLTRQQMRNCLYVGDATRWLGVMAKEESFLEATGSSLNSKTMRDRECINRFAAFHLGGWANYAGNMDTFLNETLEKMNCGIDFSSLTSAFRNSMRINSTLFGRHAFRKSIGGNSSRSVINVALFDVLSREFATWDYETVSAVSEKLKSVIVSLLSDPEFIDSISRSTNSKSSVTTRFEKLEVALSPLRP